VNHGDLRVIDASYGKSTMPNQQDLSYITGDEVSAYGAKELADQHEVALAVFDERYVPYLEEMKAPVVLSYDYITEPERHQLLNGSPIRLIGVHGYNMPSQLCKQLRSRGVAVSKRFDAAFLVAVVATSLKQPSGQVH
jgi:hypothetical protein